MDLEKRKAWSQLRYSYYCSGRNEMLLGNYGAAGILLGYAVETSLKHALIESGFSDLSVLNKHEVQILMRECRKQGTLDSIEVSDDFLDYINDHFKPRYPSLRKKVQDDISSKGRVDTIGPLLLSWYDDLMFQIDDWIYKYTSDNLASCFFRATGDVYMLKGRLFFHANYHACAMLEQMVTMREKHQGDNTHIINELRKGALNLWSTVTGVIPAQNFNNVRYQKNFCKRFHYAKWSAEDKPIFRFHSANCIIVNQLPWEDPV